MSTTQKPITSLADLTKLTKAALSGGLESQEFFYKADEVEALVAHLTPATLAELDIARIKKGFKTVRAQDRARLCDDLGVHFAYLEAVLSQPGDQQSSFTPAAFRQLVERAITRWPGLAKAMGQPEKATCTMCTVPPAGWECSRVAGHEGPCAARKVHVSGQTLTLLTDNVPSFFDGDGCHGTDEAIGFAMPDGRKILLPDLEPEEISELVAQVNAAYAQRQVLIVAKEQADA